MLELTGEQRIPAPRQKVWDALNDARTLRACIAGCESLEPSGEYGFAAVVVVKVGLVEARFSGRVELSNINVPESCTIAGDGKGGAAGTAKGTADVVLETDGDGTLLRYAATADVGGKLATTGSRLIRATAQKYIADFFSRFCGYVTGAEPLPVETPAAVAVPVTGASAHGAGVQGNVAHLRRVNWAMLTVIVGLAAYILVAR